MPKKYPPHVADGRFLVDEKLGEAEKSSIQSSTVQMASF